MAEFFVYLNRVHKYAKVHGADCIFWDHGAGLHHKGTVPWQASGSALCIPLARRFGWPRNGPSPINLVPSARRADPAV